MHQIIMEDEVTIRVSDLKVIDQELNPESDLSFGMRRGSFDGMSQLSVRFLTPFHALAPMIALAGSDVHVLGEMRRMFTTRDIRPNVDLAKINQNPHVYALGPVAGLRGEITVLDGQVFVSKKSADHAMVAINSNVKSVFLVYASVPAWRSINLPTNVSTEQDIAKFLETQVPTNSRSAFLVQATALSARYHIQNYKGKAADLTHEAHDKAKAFFEITNLPVELVGFFTNREGDAGSFVHMGQTTHIHLISTDRKQMGHLESIKLAPGARVMLPQTQ
jgi:acetolactate decarboxylase